MIYKVILDPFAKMDIQESLDWYNKAQEKLGHKFFTEIKATIQFISINPYYFAVRYMNTRMAMVDKFPFMIHYAIDDEKKIIVVFAVLHTSRSPKIWDIRSK